MPSVDYMREVVKDMYSSPGWVRKVKNMSNEQVIAIYMRNFGGSKPKSKVENRKPPEPNIPF